MALGYDEGREAWGSQITYLEIDEGEDQGAVRLELTGELDLGSAPRLEDRLGRLRETKHPVRLDLSKLEFIDSTGIRVLIQALDSARASGWQFNIEPELTPQVRRVFELVRLDHVIEGEDRG